MTTPPALFLLVAAVAAAAKAAYERWLSPLANIPGPLLYAVSGLPLQYQILRGQTPALLLALHARYGPIVRVGPRRVSVSEIGAIRHILGTNGYRKTRVFGMTQVFTPNTLTTLSPAVSAERRRLLGPGFAHGRLRDMEAAILQCGVTNLHQAIDARLQDGCATIQYKDLFTLAAFDTIGALAFGEDFGALRTGTHELLPALEYARNIGHLNAAIPLLGWAGALLRVVPRPLHLLAQFASDAISRRRRDGAGTAAPDLLQLMLDASQGDGSGAVLTHADMVSETAVLLNAGMETTAITTACAVLLLLHNPHILGRLAAEIRQKFPADSAAPITYDDCREQLPLLSAVINETLRLFSPAPFVTRRVPAGGAAVLGHYCPEGTSVLCAFNGHHRNPRIFPLPDVFNPDRFMGTSAAVARQSMLAFSVGVRSCLGRNLAVFEIHIVLANLLRNYDLALAGATARAKGSEAQSGMGVVPDIPLASRLVLGPQFPDRDCLASVSRAAAPQQ